MQRNLSVTGTTIRVGVSREMGTVTITVPVDRDQWLWLAAPVYDEAEREALRPVYRWILEARQRIYGEQARCGCSVKTFETQALTLLLDRLDGRPDQAEIVAPLLEASGGVEDELRSL